MLGLVLLHRLGQVTAHAVQLGNIGPGRELAEVVEDSPVGVEADQGHHQAQQPQHQANAHHVLGPAIHQIRSF